MPQLGCAMPTAVVGVLVISGHQSRVVRLSPAGKAQSTLGAVHVPRVVGRVAAAGEHRQDEQPAAGVRLQCSVASSEAASAVGAVQVCQVVGRVAAAGQRRQYEQPAAGVHMRQITFICTPGGVMCQTGSSLADCRHVGLLVSYAGHHSIVRIYIPLPRVHLRHDEHTIASSGKRQHPAWPVTVHTGTTGCPWHAWLAKRQRVLALRQHGQQKKCSLLLVCNMRCNSQCASCDVQGQLFPTCLSSVPSAYPICVWTETAPDPAHGVHHFLPQVVGHHLHLAELIHM